ncbi:hypothetical protein KY289_011285 [Solanum tuberosum]|nr:hypothetical protein KY289_011285 [Solanum tuberosum]
MPERSKGKEKKKNSHIEVPHKTYREERQRLKKSRRVSEKCDGMRSKASASRLPFPVDMSRPDIVPTPEQALADESAKLTLTAEA